MTLKLIKNIIIYNTSILLKKEEKKREREKVSEKISVRFQQNIRIIIIVIIENENRD
jgi:hypothetical protein